MLPRQFHVTVVENRTAGELRMAGILFPLYLVAINIFVLPVAIAGLLTFGGGGNADLYVLALPLHAGMPVVSLITFIGGFSAATAMVIVASVALAIMVSNDIVMPVFLRRKLTAAQRSARRFRTVSAEYPPHRHFRRPAARLCLLPLDRQSAGLASIGLLSFAAIAQMAPSLLGGLVWRRANARGAIAGLVRWLFRMGLFAVPAEPRLSQNDHAAGTDPGFLFPGTTVFSRPRLRQLGQCDAPVA